MSEEPVKRGPGRPRKLPTSEILAIGATSPTPLADIAARLAEPTAVEQLAALKAREFAGNGLLIPPPVPMTLQSAHKWLSEIAEVGSGGHVEIAWLRVPNDFKDRLVNEYVRLANEAGRRHAVLEERAMAEEAAERAAHQERMKTVTKEREKASLRARLAALEVQD